jgi:putative transposase
LRALVRKALTKSLLHINAWVVLPDHLHCVWTLPTGDDDFANRWRLIKQGFSNTLPFIEPHTSVRIVCGKLAIWQRRSWEHAIGNEQDYAEHVDCCNINPLKHGYV